MVSFKFLVPTLLLAASGVVAAPVASKSLFIKYTVELELTNRSSARHF
jgi:hypothetical protein